MAEQTAIGWTKSTFNPWVGCTKVGPGCDNCYAAALDERRFSKTLGGATAAQPITHWGPGAPRHRTSMQNWKQPMRWHRQQTGLLAGWNSGLSLANGDERELLARGFHKPAPWRVFCSSLADVFDNEVPDQWRADLWDLIEETPNLEWLLVTKRIGNVARMLRTIDWAASPRWNVRILITVVNEEEVYRDLPKLLALPCKNGVSYEPAQGLVNWKPWLKSCGPGIVSPDPHGRDKGLEWLIVGGESGPKARLFDIAWARAAVAQCREAGVPVFVKQLGADPRVRISNTDALFAYAPRIKDPAGADPAEWPEDLRVQEFPA